MSKENKEELSFFQEGLNEIDDNVEFLDEEEIKKKRKENEDDK